MADLTVVLVFAPRPLRLRTPPGSHPGETRELDCRCYVGDDDLDVILARERPDVIASFGARAAYPRLAAARSDVRARWLHFETDAPSEADLERAGAMLFCLFLHRLLVPPAEAVGTGSPLVSVFTPTYRTGDRLGRTYRSLRSQTYEHWEWTVVDDSDDEGATLRRLEAIARAEPRLSVHSMHRHSGRIGEVKRRACALSQGAILVELDHDDELTPNALTDVVAAFHDAGVGFVYSDWADLAENTGTPLSYGDGWAFGYGSYRTEHHDGRPLLVANAPPLNAHTIRHIVSAPNHVRAWRRDVYWQIGGHNPGIHVADDYELVLRTFLHARMVHIPRLCYLQYLRSGRNAQDDRRAEIQRLVRVFREHYEEQIHHRLLDLGLDDPLWPETAERVPTGAGDRFPGG